MIEYPLPNLKEGHEIVGLDLENKSITVLAKTKEIDVTVGEEVFKFGGHKSFHTFPLYRLIGRDSRRAIKKAKSLERKGLTGLLKEWYGVSSGKELEEIHIASVIAALGQHKTR
jgi:hypothetical protein